MNPLKLFPLLLLSILFSVTMKAQFCYPTFTSGCSAGKYIDSVWAPGNLSLINNASVCTGSSPSFNTTYFDTICVVRGQTYPISVQTSDASLQIAAYIDLNGDQDFSDIGEEILMSPTPQLLHSGTYTIPASSLSGVQRLRIIATDTLPNPLCGTFGSGEIEEYFVNIIPAGPGPLASCGCVTASSLNLSGCDSVISPSTNQVWYANGNYTDTVLNSNSCDSVIYANVTIHSLNDSIYQSNGTLLAFQNSVSYQWYNCTSSTILTNDTLQTYTPPFSGDYACIISDSNCMDTTKCMTVITTDIKDVTEKNSSIYPNPAKNILVLKTNNARNKEIVITTITGKIVLTKSTKDSETELHISDLPSGLYFLKVLNEDSSVSKKFLKE